MFMSMKCRHVTKGIEVLVKEVKKIQISKNIIKGWGKIDEFGGKGGGTREYNPSKEQDEYEIGQNTI